MKFKSIGLIFAVTILVLVLIVSVGTAKLVSYNESRLENSLIFLAKDFMGITYFHVKEYTDDVDPVDAHRSWWITVDFSDDISLNEAFHVADDVDSKYYKEKFRKLFSTKDNLKKYTLFRAERSLGPQSICESNYCNIYLLYNRCSNDIFVEISNN